MAASGPGVRGAGLREHHLHLCRFPRHHPPGGEGASGRHRVTQHLFSAASPPCILCTPDSRLMAWKPQPRLQLPVWTVGPQRRHPRPRAVVWMTLTSWGRPSCSSRCPRSRSKCGGEGPPCPDPPLPRAQQKGPWCWFAQRMAWPEHHHVPSAARGSRDTAVTRGGAGPVHQGMDRIRHRSVPHSHALPQACRPLRKTQRAARKEGAEPPSGWGEHELPAPK